MKNAAFTMKEVAEALLQVYPERFQGMDLTQGDKPMTIVTDARLSTVTLLEGHHAPPTPDIHHPDCKCHRCV